MHDLHYSKVILDYIKNLKFERDLLLYIFTICFATLI